jgi:hypothetical protein
MKFHNNLVEDQFTAEDTQLLRELNVNIGGSFRVANIDFGIDDAWLDEFVEDTLGGSGFDL